jgi:DNA invertase Pin-like site-specific DNA recombinase
MKQKQNKTIAYLRVSSIDQDIEKNKADILKLANDKGLSIIKQIGGNSRGVLPLNM